MPTTKPLQETQSLTVTIKDSEINRSSLLGSKNSNTDTLYVNSSLEGTNYKGAIAGQAVFLNSDGEVEVCEEDSQNAIGILAFDSRVPIGGANHRTKKKINTIFTFGIISLDAYETVQYSNNSTSLTYYPGDLLYISPKGLLTKEVSSVNGGRRVGVVFKSPDSETNQMEVKLFDFASQDIGSGGGGGGTSVTVAGHGISLSGQEISLDIGTSSTQIAAGDHGHIISDITGLNSALSDRILSSDLLSGGKIKPQYYSALVLTSVNVVSTIVDRDALTVEEGDVSVVTNNTPDDTLNGTYIYDGSSWVELDSVEPVEWSDVTNPPDLVDTNSISLTYDGLNNEYEADLLRVSPGNLTGGSEGEIGESADGVYVVLGTTNKTAAAGDHVQAVDKGGTGLTSATEGDILYSDGTNSIASLGVGTSGQYLKVNSGEDAPEWSDITVSDVVSLTDMLNNKADDSTSHDPVTISGNGVSLTDQELSLDFGTSSGQVAEGDHVQDVDKGGTNITSYTKGDILAASAPTTLVKLPVGTDGQFLVADSGEASGLNWSNSNSTSVSDTDTINLSMTGDIVSGQVILQGTGGLVANGSGIGADFGTGTNQIARGDHGHVISDITGLTSALGDRILTSDLLTGGKIKSQYYSPLALSSVNVVDTIVDRDALTVEEGDVSVVTDNTPDDTLNGTYIYDGSSWVGLSSAGAVEWADIANPPDLVDTNSISLTYDGLNNEYEADLLRVSSGDLTGGSEGEIGESADGVYVVLGTTNKTAAAGDHVQAVDKGGTGLTSATEGDILYSDGADSIASLGIGTSGQCLLVNSGEDAPEWGNITVTETIEVALEAPEDGDVYKIINDTPFEMTLTKLSSQLGATSGSVTVEFFHNTTAGTDSTTLGTSTAVEDGSSSNVQLVMTDTSYTSTSTIDGVTGVIASGSTFGLKTTVAGGAAPEDLHVSIRYTKTI